MISFIAHTSAPFQTCWYMKIVLINMKGLPWQENHYHCSNPLLCSQTLSTTFCTLIFTTPLQFGSKMEKKKRWASDQDILQQCPFSNPPLSLRIASLCTIVLLVDAMKTIRFIPISCFFGCSNSDRQALLVGSCDHAFYLLTTIYINQCHFQLHSSARHSLKSQNHDDPGYRPAVQALGEVDFQGHSNNPRCDLHNPATGNMMRQSSCQAINHGILWSTAIYNWFSWRYIVLEARNGLTPFFTPEYENWIGGTLQSEAVVYWCKTQ